MQEATEDLVQHQGIGGHFAGSWRYPFPKGPTIGLMTLSKVPPGQLIPLPTRHREFFITAPKLSLATKYPLADGRNLLLINVHILAFERWRSKAVSEQLQGLKAVMLAHEGPIILAGDFNTWNRQRLAMLEQLASELGLTEVVGFPDGRRTGGTGYRWADKMYGISWGLPLDRIYYRGFSAYSAEVLPYDSSDHAALLVRLALQINLESNTRVSGVGRPSGRVPDKCHSNMTP
jgi:endonuclease/exonuclease/phosphatase (EEP) superfamily protein YafD